MGNKDGFQALVNDDRPIGLFDSGIGGLTVLRSLLHALPNESFVYLGDTARLPYGSKSPETIERYLKQNVRFLEKQNVKAVIVACNTASTVLIEKPLSFSVPVYNVIEPGAESALKVSQTRTIGILATKATVAASSYPHALARRDSGVIVYQTACPLLVPLVEEGWEDDPLTNLVIYRYVQPLLQAAQAKGTPIDALILGCTHYPALRGGIGRVAGPNVHLVDSSEAIATALKADFQAARLKTSQARQPLKIMTTDISPSFREVAERLMRPHAIPELEAVDVGSA